jgi:heavy metal sensor kinase
VTPAAAPPRAIRRPIRTRVQLTMWYTLLLAGSLLVLGSVGLWLVNRALWDNLDDMLRSRVAGIESDLAHDEGRFGIDDAREVDALGASLDIVRIWNRAGKLVYGREGSTRVTTSSSSPPNEIPATGQVAEERLSDGRTARVVTHVVADQGRVQGYVQAGRATDEIESILARLRILGVGGLLVTLVVAGVGGSFLAGRALTPIERITREARRISADDLARRLDLNLPDDELGRLAEAFDEMLARLDGAFERQRRFTADASHELRTPLGIIRSQIDVALGRPRSAEYHARVLASVRDETDRLTRLTESLLTLARADDGEAIARHTVDCEDLVAEVGAHVAPRARDLGVHLSVQVGECPLVLGDANWLTQLLLNLLDNALRHTPRGGRVELSVQSTDQQVAISVADSGEGIAPEHLPHLAERFYRVDRARGRNGGAGLGLAISAWIARVHGGVLHIESTVGHGTLATVLLPSTPHTAAAQGSEDVGERPLAVGVTANDERCMGGTGTGCDR